MRTSYIGLSVLLAVMAAGCNRDKPTIPDGSSAQSQADERGSAAPEQLADSAEYPLPKENSVDALLEYLQSLNPQQIPRDAQYLDRLRPMMEARVLAAQRLLRLQNDPQRQSHLVAAETQLESLRILAEIDTPGAAERLDAYVKQLRGHDNPELARIGRFGTLQVEADQLRKKSDSATQQDYAAFASSFEKTLSEEPKDERLYLATSDIARTMTEMARTIEQANYGVALLKKVGNTFAASSNMELATRATSLLDYAEMVSLQNTLQAAADEPEQLDRFEQQFRQVLERPVLSSTIVSNALGLLQHLEYSGHVEPALRLYEAVADATDKVPDTLVRAEVNRTVENARKRLSLLGNPIELDGVAVDGSPFDWSNYAGKVVLVDFWATWCGPCIRAIPNIREAYDNFHDQGFDVVGVNIDSDRDAARAFVEQNQLPWTTIVTADPAVDNAQNPNAQRYGVEAIPFLVLVGRDGKVAALHTHGPELAVQVRRLLEQPADAEQPAESNNGAPPEEPSAEEPSSEEPSSEEPSSEEPSSEEPSPDEPSSDEPSSGEPSPDEPSPGEPSPDEPSPEEQSPDEPSPDEPSPDEPSPDEPSSDEPSSDEPSDNADPVPTEQEGPADEPADAVSDGDQPLAVLSDTVNPYDPPPGLDAAQLVEFLWDMQDKPKSIQLREGFTDGIARAADQILEQDGVKDQFREVAALTKLQYLHRDACLGDEQSDERLAQAVEAFRGETLPKIAEEVAFLTAEREALNSLPAEDDESVSEEQLRESIAKLQQYFSDHQSKLSARHLRMASVTVELINRLPDEQQREEQYTALGKTLAASEDKSLAGYGRRLARSSPLDHSELIGKPLELAGATADGTSLDWESYRGQVVLVDFWATWCGPCRAALPQLLETHEAHREQGLRVLGVNLDEEGEALAEFLKEMPLPWAQLVGEPASEAAERYGVRGIPTLMLVDRQGNVAAVGNHLNDLREPMEQLLEEGDRGQE